MEPPLWRRLLCRFSFHELTSRLEEEGRPKLISDLSQSELADLLRQRCKHCEYDPDRERRELLRGDKVV